MRGELNLRVREGGEGGVCTHETALVELLFNNPWSTPCPLLDTAGSTRPVDLARPCVQIFGQGRQES